MQIKNIKQVKVDLRSNYKSLRTRMFESGEKHILDSKIAKKLFLTREYKKSSLILTYVSKDIEVDTKNIIINAIKDGKRVAVPKCIVDTHLMEFYEISSLDDLEKGTFGVLEPIVEKCKLLENFPNALCIVPGFSFDLKGYRLGYGKGYYDRFLSGFEGNTVGICYKNCMRSLLPHGYFDKPVDVLVTESYIRTIKKTGERSNVRQK